VDLIIYDSADKYKKIGINQSKSIINQSIFQTIN